MIDIWGNIDNPKEPGRNLLEANMQGLSWLGCTTEAETRNRPFKTLIFPLEPVHEWTTTLDELIG